MYLLFLFCELWEGVPLGGMKDFAGYFETIWSARQYTESQLWHKYSHAQITEVDMGLKAERCGYDTVAEYPVLESLTIVLEGLRLGRYEDLGWEWKEVKVHYPVKKGPQ